MSNTFTDLAAAKTLSNATTFCRVLEEAEMAYYNDAPQGVVECLLLQAFKGDKEAALRFPTPAALYDWFITRPALVD